MGKILNKKITPSGLDKAIEILDEDVKAFKIEISEYVVDQIYLDTEIRHFLKSLYCQLNGIEDDVQGLKDILAEQEEENERV